MAGWKAGSIGGKFKLHHYPVFGFVEVAQKVVLGLGIASRPA